MQIPGSQIRTQVLTYWKHLLKKSECPYAAFLNSLNKYTHFLWLSSLKILVACFLVSFQWPHLHKLRCFIYLLPDLMHLGRASLATISIASLLVTIYADERIRKPNKGTVMALWKGIVPRVISQATHLLKQKKIRFAKEWEVPHQMVMNLGSSNDQQQLLPFIGLQDHRLFTCTLLFNALRVLF